MLCQLRVYVINRGKLDDFVTGWTAGVYPLRRAHGFDIPCAWVDRERNQFIWLLAYDGPEGWEEKERAYYGSQERAGLEPDPRQYIAQANQWFVSPVDLPEVIAPQHF